MNMNIQYLQRVSCSTHDGCAGHRQIICIPEDIFPLFQANIPGNGEPKGKTPLVRILPPLANKYHRDSLSMFTLKRVGYGSFRQGLLPYLGFPTHRLFQLGLSPHYQPISFFRRYLNVTLGSPLMKISPSCSVVAILRILIPLLMHSRLNQCVLIP